MKIALQQAQERALRLESELSTAQDRIGAAERRATQAEQRHSLLQKRMDDWDAFDPDLHAALNASLTPPNTGEQMQPTGSAHPAGSDATVQSTQQVHPHGQTEQLFSRKQLQSVLFGQSVQTGTMQTTFPPVQAAPSIGQQQAQTFAQQVQTPPSGNSGDAVDSTASSDVTFRPGWRWRKQQWPEWRWYATPISLPLLAPNVSRHRVRLSPFR